MHWVNDTEGINSDLDPLKFSPALNCNLSPVLKAEEQQNICYHVCNKTTLVFPSSLNNEVMQVFQASVLLVDCLTDEPDGRQNKELQNDLKGLNL
jgi:hypothetical protein